MLWWVKHALLVAGVLLLHACGYSLNHRLKGPFEDPRGIYVPVFLNTTDETSAEYVFTNALIHEIQSRGNVVFASRKEGAIELRGTVTSIQYSSSASTEAGYKGLPGYMRLPTEIQVNVGIALSLVDPKTQSVMWSGTFSGFRRVPAPVPRTYSYEAPSSMGPITQSLVESYYLAIAQDIMRDAYDEMVELF